MDKLPFSFGLNFSLSKEQMQLAIIKKKQCDAKALTIVMQLLESHVDPDWLLQNVSVLTNIVSHLSSSSIQLDLNNLA